MRCIIFPDVDLIVRYVYFKIAITIVYVFTSYRLSTVTQYSFILRLINSFRIFRSSENEFLEILTTLKSNPNTAQKLHKAMIKELYNSMNDDLEDTLKEGSLQETFAKIAKLSEESMMSSNKHAWSVDTLENSS